MKTRWLLLGEDWYYLDALNGDMRIGWIRSGADWYYMNPEDGVMETEWIFDGKNYYYLDSEGRMYYSTVVEGYELNGSGACVNPDDALKEKVNGSAENIE